tara:strand:- start:78 stop:323 length:246 start_codon:yes stop_codon:yes gene_type:complete
MKKIDDFELKQLQETVELQKNLLARLGDTEFQIITLNEEKEQIVKTINDITVKRTNKLEELQAKYGKGSLNIDTGEFTVTK